MKTAKPPIDVSILNNPKMAIQEANQFGAPSSHDGDSEGSQTEGIKQPSRDMPRALDRLNFLLTDVRTGAGPFLGTYLD